MKEFTQQQLLAIELFSRGNVKNKQVADTVGVSETSIYNWKNNKAFSEAIIDKTQDYFRNSLPDVTKSLLAKAKDGDLQAIKIYFDHLAFVEKLRANRSDINVSFSWDLPQECTQ